MEMVAWGGVGDSCCSAAMLMSAKRPTLQNTAFLAVSVNHADGRQPNVYSQTSHLAT